MTTRALLFLPILLVAACGTFTRGGHEKLKVTSDPEFADVTLSTGERGITPAQFVKSRRKSFSVTVSKPGYLSTTVNVQRGPKSLLYPNPVSVRLLPDRGTPPAVAKAPEKKSKAVTSSPKRPSTPKPSPPASAKPPPPPQNTPAPTATPEPTATATPEPPIPVATPPPENKAPMVTPLPEFSPTSK